MLGRMPPLSGDVILRRSDILALHLSAKIRPTRKAIQVLSLAAPYT
jgi:hypothetical protein